MRVLRVMVAVAALGLPGAAQAQLDAENLLVNMPEGFKVGSQAANRQFVMSEFIPEGETVEDWSTMVTVQVLRGTSADGDQLAEQVKSGWTGVCAGATVERRDAGTVNGYPWVLWHFGCPMNPQTGKPEAMWLKAVRGADALYVVQQAHRALPSDELEARAVEYLGSVSVCDTHAPEHPCPAGM